MVGNQGMPIGLTGKIKINLRLVCGYATRTPGNKGLVPK